MKEADVRWCNMGIVGWYDRSNDRAIEREDWQHWSFD
jgi:hypothetical protein